MRRKSFQDEDEKILLENFASGPLKLTLDNPNGKDSYGMCAHNGKVFDFPFIAKRMIINGLPLPNAFDYDGKKPWDLKYLLDTKDEWKFNIFDGSVSLATLCEVFNVPTSKDDIDGSEVKDIFWKEKDLPRIVRYCEKDILALSRVFLKMKSMQDEVRVPDGE